MRTAQEISIIYLNLISFSAVFLGCAPEGALVDTTPEQNRFLPPNPDSDCGGGLNPDGEGFADDAGSADHDDSAMSLALYGNTPNPFNPATSISFAVPKDSGFVTLSIHSVDGRYARRLVATNLSAGKHTVVWLGRDDAGRKLPSGVYVASLRSGDEICNRKLAIVQ